MPAFSILIAVPRTLLTPGVTLRGWW